MCLWTREGTYVHEQELNCGGNMVRRLAMRDIQTMQCRKLELYNCVIFSGLWSRSSFQVITPGHPVKSARQVLLLGLLVGSARRFFAVFHALVCIRGLHLVSRFGIFFFSN